MNNKFRKNLENILKFNQRIRVPEIQRNPDKVFGSEVG